MLTESRHGGWAPPGGQSRRRLCVTIGAVAGLAATVVRFAAFAQAPPEAAQAFIAALRADVLAAVASDRPRDAARAAVERLVADAFDLPAIAQAALRAQSATAAQRDRLATVLARRMCDELLRRQGGAGLDFRIVTVRATAPQEWLVVSQVTPPDGAATILGWRVRRAAAGLRVVDVVRDGVSAVILQRDEIDAGLRAGRSLDAVIDAIERRAP